MNYPTRISLALGAATAIVAASIASTPRVLGSIEFGAVVVPEPRPIQLDLRDLQPLPPEPEVEKDDPKRLIDAGADAQAPVRETDLISSRDTQAQDMSDKAGDETRPAADQVDEFDQLGSAPSAPTPPPQPAPEPAAESTPAEPMAEATPAEPVTAAEETPSGPEPETESPGVAVADQPKEEPPAPSAKPAEPEARIASAPEAAEKKVEAPKPEPKAETQPERFQVAAAQPQPPAPEPTPPRPQVPVQELRASKGRDGGGATNSGFTSFEANKHALGEYMLQVRNKVEREWRTALHLRYSGVSRTDATIKCSIRPDGTLEFVEITDAGSSLTYAVLCREAIEKAGPFEPFPFDVPEIYRNENLEINWRFSYM